MEYKIFRYVRHHVVIPSIIRMFVGIILILLSTLPIVLPLFPGSFFLWVFMLVVWLVLFVHPKKVKHVVKLRKWLTYLVQNIRKKHIIRHKIYDIKKHIKIILDKKHHKR